MYIENMYSGFAYVLWMSLIAAIVIIILLLLRPMLKKFPRIFSYLLWGIVLFRLLCPVSFESSVSIFHLAGSPLVTELLHPQPPEAVEVSEETFEYVIVEETVVLPDEKVTQTAVNGEITEEIHDYQPTEVMKPPVWKWLLPVIWIIGVGAVSGYGVGSYISLKKELAGAVKEEDGNYSCDNIKTAFVLGFLFPKVYIPSDLEESKKRFILLHEQTHMKRGDSVFRLLAYMALAIHWFNPFVWIAFHLSEADMELSCDEAVMRNTKEDIRKEYAATLLEIASGKHILFSGFPAFGENQTKERIQAVVNYKKQSVAILVIGCGIVAVLVLVLASNPKYLLVTETSETHYVEGEDTAKREAYVQTEIALWASAFINRDGNTIIDMSTREARKRFEEGMLLVEENGSASFGWSSPWPSLEKDCFLKLLEEDRATILYYARTSDPHITVWAEHLEFEMSEDFESKDDFKITRSEILFLDSIQNVAEFVLAYEDGINNTPMDYLTNGLGEILNQNAKENKDSVWYKDLFSPETAAVSLLNLDSENVFVDASEGNTKREVILTLHFKDEEKESVLQGIKMIQPYGKDGIWIPQNYTDSVFMEDRNNYFKNYEFYKEELGENFLEEYYEKVYTVESDISRDGMDEIIEVYTGNGGDGESGYVFVKDIHGNILFHEYAHVARVAWNMIFFSEDNFLMNVHMEDRDTYGEYSYEVYRVVGKDEIQILAKDSFSFDMEGQTLDEEKKQKLQEFMDTLHLYLEQSKLLLSTQECELKAIGLSEEELTLEDITSEWYLWKKIEQGTELELPVG
mgnify:FL=1